MKKCQQFCVFFVANKINKIYKQNIRILIIFLHFLKLKTFQHCMQNLKLFGQKRRMKHFFLLFQF